MPELDDPDRLEALGLIRHMYMNERHALEIAAGRESETALADARKGCRQMTGPLVKAYFSLCEKIVGRGLPPSSPLVKAANYSLRQREELSVFLKNPLVGIDNNPAENAIRPWALGRKNWLFVGNERGGEKSAIIASLVATCKDNKVDFKAWLEDVLTRLGTTRHDDIDSLLPHNWTPARN